MKEFPKRLVEIAILDLFLVLLCFGLISNETGSSCGLKDEKPELGMGLSPSWFDGRFQIRKGSKEIVSSRVSRSPVSDPWVKGAELFVHITAYDLASDEHRVLFRAIDDSGIESVFALTATHPEAASGHVYEVKRFGDDTAQAEWINVDGLQCRAYRLRYIFYFALAALVLVTAVMFIMWFSVGANADTEQDH